jgi:hypothetical protein
MTSSDSPILTVPPACTHTLGAELERDRLERRVRRLTVAIHVLRQRESENRRESGAPKRHLGRAVADFEAQVETMKTRLHDLGMTVHQSRYSAEQMDTATDAYAGHVERIRGIAT